MVALEFVWKDLTKPSKTIFFPMSCLIANETPISGTVFYDGPAGGGGPGVLGFWPWSCCSCQAINLFDFCLQSYGLFRVKGNSDRKISRLSTQVKESRGEW